jgi:hypothetical protein
MYLDVMACQGSLYLFGGEWPLLALYIELNIFESERLND